MMTVTLYMIREKVSGLYLCSKRRDFGSFEDAVGMGVMFNQRKSAEKRIKEEMKRFSGAHGLVYTRYRLDEKYYTPDLDYALEESKRYEIEYRPIELEVAEILLTPKGE